MKMIFAIFVLASAGLGICSFYEFIASIGEETPHFFAICMVLLSVVIVVRISRCEFRGKGRIKQAQMKQSPMPEASFEKTFARRMLFGKVLSVLLFASLVAMVFSIALAVLGGAVFHLLFAKIFAPSLYVLAIGSYIYFLGYRPLNKCIKILRRKGLAMEECLAAAEAGAATPSGRIVCMSHVLVSKRDAIILPYSTIVWMYQTSESITGVQENSHWHVCTDDGSCFSVTMEQEDVTFILENHGDRFSKSLILGFSADQQTEYYQLVERAKNEGMDWIEREVREKDRKKTCGLVVALVSALALSVFAATFFKESVAFSQDVMLNKKCHIDVIEIEPLAWDYDDILYCRCTLVSGETVWMKIEDYKYRNFFDFQAEIKETPCVTRGVKYTEAVRLTGVALESDKNVSGVTEDAKMFKFYEAKRVQMQVSDIETRYAGVEYSPSVKSHWFVYADIIRIEVESFSLSYKNDNDGTATCKCLLASGEEAELYIDIEDYLSYIDASAEFKNDGVLYGTAPDPVFFITPVRIFGSIDYNQRIKFGYTDKEKIESAKSGNQPEVEFSDSVIEGQRVYATLSLITPLYEVSDYLHLLEGAKYYVCRGVCTDGGTIWIYISTSGYRQYFSSNNTTIRLYGAVLHGTVKRTDSINNGEEKLNAEWMIDFESVEKN